MTNQELEDLLNRAAKRGAKEALDELGFHEPEEVREIRGLLDSWRQVKSTILHTTVRVITTAVLAMIAIGVAVKLKLFGG
jgi:hypothetical protein